jgi:hypothetical protein
MLNAWTGQEAAHGEMAGWDRWALKGQTEAIKVMAAQEPVDLRDWRDERVGWGLVLPENKELSVTEKAAAADAPEMLRELLKARPGSPVLRYRASQMGQFLRRYDTDGQDYDLQLSGSERGAGKNKLPRYLLIYGSPQQIPWRFQYLLNGPCFTGRLDLTGEALENYVAALLTDWKDAACQAAYPVVWATDHGADDITWLMRHTIAEPLRDKLAGDPQIKEVRTLVGDEATWPKLLAALSEAERQPALVVTTSHGMTGPVGNPEAMARDLGILVDARRRLSSPDEIIAVWQPDGAVWYAHACCSAGSDKQTRFQGLAPAGSSVEQVLLAVAGLGARIAPLPQALLGTKRPLRAFIGHVEPTFDWTLRQPRTRQALTETIQQALYDQMYRERPAPVGLAFDGVYRHVGELLSLWQEAFQEVASPDAAKRKTARRMALETQLTALDRQSMVILGDPTVALPPFA